MTSPQFGKRPSGERLTRIKQSPQFQHGKFQNFSETPQVTQNLGIALYDYVFKKSKRVKPNENITAIPVNWEAVDKNKDALIWFGHSSYLLVVDGKTILVDPVLGKNASPIPGGGRPFSGSKVTEIADLPFIDYLFISHDHYDHMDYETLKSIQPKVGKVIAGLGVGAHLEYWGYTAAQIIEKDWWEKVDLGDNFNVIVTPARHFSGRSIWSANTLWASYVLQTPTKNIYLGGDSGYDTHFAQIGQQYGPFDMAILENGQYDKSWKYIHMFPEEVVKAANDLQAKVIFPVHSGKFVLANHAWDEPLQRISDLCVAENIPLITPIIGEVIDWNTMQTKPTYWWKNVK
ncbi:MBL fold metallo-hydrolase [Sphingobacterium sp. Mn56C]|uniref:MBL fold metallo-hydrolase n=1 Tax=Sphingobacterium sp. Mn56C TaxID=3395261 RepID=UPI003BBAC120